MNDKKVSNVMERPFPNAVTYDLSTPGQVHITLPRNSTWSSGLHWHETHTEWLRLVKGSIWVRLDDKKEIYSVDEAEEMELRVPRYMWHEWGRATMDGDDVEVVERTDPEDGDKAIFFWNLNGVILDAPKMLTSLSLISQLPQRLQDLYLDGWVSLNLFVIFRYLDNVPVFLNAQRLLPVSNGVLRARLKNVDFAVSHFVLWVASWVGWVFGLQPVQARYTPDKEFAEWNIKQQNARKAT